MPKTPPSDHDSPATGETVANHLRRQVRRVVSDAFYDTRNAGGTMDQAADRAADAVLELDITAALAPDVGRVPDRTGYLAELDEAHRLMRAHLADAVPDLTDAEAALVVADLEVRRYRDRLDRTHLVKAAACLLEALARHDRDVEGVRA